MPKKGYRQFLRKVVHSFASQETTKRGNPVAYNFLLECGHWKSKPHNPYSFLRHFIISTARETISMVCDDCRKGKARDKNGRHSGGA